MSIQATFVLWLLSAVFYHLPPTFYHLLGFDARSQLSLLLVVFISTLPVLFVHHSCISWTSWILKVPVKRESLKENAITMVMNSFAISLFTSSYYALCGNEQRWFASGLVCLRPIPAESYPNFSSFMLYAESPALVVSQTTDSSPFHAIISPVLTVWITLVLLHFIKGLCDVASDASLCSVTVRGVKEAGRRDNLPHPLATASRRIKSTKQDAAPSSTTRNPKIIKTIQKREKPTLPSRVSLTSLSPFIDKVVHAVESIEMTAVKLGLLPSTVDDDAPAETGFLSMVKWFSGTNTDLLHTVIDMLISLRLLGSRFDFRMQQASNLSKQAPTEGDGFTYEFLSRDQQQEGGEGMWIDWIADTGDGGDSTYNVARHLAASDAVVLIPQSHGDDSKGLRSIGPGISPLSPLSLAQLNEATSHSQKPLTGSISLPRAKVLLIGGDLVYPNPTRSAYESRLFHPFESAFPPPPHYHPSRIACHKPDLPGQGCSLEQYPGPLCFAIPGNHDWIDGLTSFSEVIMNRGWLGGWLLPQEKSWFALHLPSDWWVLGIDLGLNNDIDSSQFRYFASLAEKRLTPESQVLIMTHQPLWILDAFWDEKTGQNLRCLIRGHLRGRARVHLAGDLHFYMRHSREPPSSSQSPQEDIKESGPTSTSNPKFQEDTGSLTPLHSLIAPTRPKLPQGGLFQSLKGISTCSEALGMDKASLDLRGNSEDGSFVDDHFLPLGESPDTRTSHLEGSSLCRGDSFGGGSSQEGDEGEAMSPGCSLPVSMSHLSLASAAGRSPKRRVRSIRAGGSSPRARGSSPPRLSLGISPSPCLTSLILQDIVAPKADKGEVEEVKEGGTCMACKISSSDPDHLIVNGAGGAFSHPTHMFPAAFHSSAQDPAALATASFFCGHKLKGCTCKAEAQGKPAFTCQAAYPSPSHSHQLGRKNLRMFRRENTTFDIIGGAIYFLIISSLIPRCRQMEKVLDAETTLEAVHQLLQAFLQAFLQVFSESYVSLLATLFLFIVALGLAKAGGVGSRSISPTTPAPSTPVKMPRLPLEPLVRYGGLKTQAIFAGLHCLSHVFIALSLMILLELGVVTCIRYENLGSEGANSLFKWYETHVEKHFPDPYGLRQKLEAYTLGFYPWILKSVFSLYDVPEAIAVGRASMCGDGGEISRFQAIFYYVGMGSFFWMLATPVVGLVFGSYLYLASTYAGVHFDESFSSLRIPDYKAITRMHLRPDGDLEIYTFALPAVPIRGWKANPMWSKSARDPSRWIPRGSDQQLQSLYLIDFVLVKRSVRDA